MNKSKIQWTDMTWNPIIGCHKISPGCDHCYAEKMANRIAHMDTWAGAQYREVVDLDGKWNWNTHLADSHMDFPRTLKKPKKIFVGSMTDIFLHSQSAEGRKDVVRLFAVMASNPQHTFQLLTKRPVEMKIFMDGFPDTFMKQFCTKPVLGGKTISEIADFKWKNPLPNVWLGVTVCNQEEANFKIPILLDTPAAKRFVSIEPMLGPIDLTSLKGNAGSYYQVLKPITGCGDSDRPALDWIIVGAETGPGARPIEYDWVYNLLGQAQSANVPFFFKSWGKLKIAPNQIDTFKQFPI